MRINGLDNASPTVSMGESERDTARGAGVAGGVVGRRGDARTSGAATPGSDGAQLSALSSVLNGLESGASAIRRHVYQAMGAVRGGTYWVDPVQLSKRIIGEALSSA
jgi:hypothetical protein